MRKLAVLIAASANQAFFSQIAAISMALRKLSWQRWAPAIYAYVGDFDEQGEALIRRWLPYMHDVEFIRVSAADSAYQGTWAQSDAVLRMAPRDADVLMQLDADTLPVRPFEDVLDRILATDEVAGVMAHGCFPTDRPWRQEWEDVSGGLISRPLRFEHQYSLVDPATPDDNRLAPFYVNGGVVIFSQRAYSAFVPPALRLRSQLMTRVHEDFASQAAFTLVVHELGLKPLPLPMRFNYPNDPRAEKFQAAEAAHIVIHHYQHRGHFDRHRIFTSTQEYARFQALELEGINARFQKDVREVLGEAYPFPLADDWAGSRGSG